MTDTLWYKWQEYTMNEDQVNSARGPLTVQVMTEIMKENQDVIDDFVKDMKPEDEIEIVCTPAKITEFTGEYSFLSASFPTDVCVDGLTYPTLIHAYQAIRNQSWDLRESIRKAKTIEEVRKIGREQPTRPDWERVKVRLIRQLVTDKFIRNRSIKQQLMMTKEAEIVETAWLDGDAFWGTIDGQGENHHGQMLMKMRQECVQGLW